MYKVSKIAVSNIFGRRVVGAEGVDLGGDQYTVEQRRAGALRSLGAGSVGAGAGSLLGAGVNALRPGMTSRVAPIGGAIAGALAMGLNSRRKRTNVVDQRGNRVSGGLRRRVLDQQRMNHGRG